MRRISRKTRLLMVAVAIALLSALAVLLNGIATGTIVSSWPALVASFIVTGLIPILLFLREWLHSKPVASEYRQRMLGLVQNTWITGFLENPLYYSYDEQLLPLALRKRVGSRFDLVLSNPLEEPMQIISPGTTLTQVFDQAKGELLILGEPGAGKTTLLLELARDLLKRAEDDEVAPIPVVLMLASWATEKLPLEQWIVKELQMKYDIPSQIGKEWVKTNQLLLLLDGLDEVASDVLPACIKVINEYYRQVHRSLAVCSRMKEFQEQQGRLALQTAVTVQPLSSEQVDIYLNGLAAKGEDIGGLKQALYQSEELRVLATTPLFLTVLILAYHGKPVQELLALVKATLTDQQHLIFQDYVERILQREGPRIHALAQQTKHWLAWLARQLTTHQQSELYLERLQPDWLPQRQRAFYQWSIRLVFGLVGGLVGLYFGLPFGLVLGLVGGLYFGLFGGLLGGLTKIKPVEVISWSWKDLAFGLVYVLAFGLFFGLFIGLAGGLLGGLVSGLLSGLSIVLAVGLVFVLFFGLFIGLSAEQRTERSILSPNEGIRHSVINGLVSGLVYGLVSGLVIGLPIGLYRGLPFGLAAGLGIGLVFVLVIGLVNGLGAAVQHYTLRFWLWHTHLFPWQAVPFLEDAVEQLLLRKVGGGYVFRHRLLQDYFASLEEVPLQDSSVHAEAEAELGSLQKSITSP